MFLKKIIDKSIFDKNGYVLLSTHLKNSSLFNKLCNEIDWRLNKQIKKSNLKKLGGYIVGNLNINQGLLGSKLYSLVFKKEFKSYFEKLTSKKVSLFDIRYSGNLTLPGKGTQLFHIDGGYKSEMYLVSIATQEITVDNGPTEICVGSHIKPMSFDEFFFSKKKIKKLTMKKGQIIIRKHNLWHRGTKNYSIKPRLLLSFVITPKNKKSKNVQVSSKFQILRNSFGNNLTGKLYEVIYVKLRFLVIFIKILLSYFKKISN
jgi:hypothetical protein